MGNSPEMYEAWRQNARADHERPQMTKAQIRDIAQTKMPSEETACDECGEQIPNSALVHHDHLESCSLHPSASAELSEETLALADAMPGCGQREPHSDQVTATLYVGLNHPNSGDWYLQDVGNVVSARHDGFTMTNGVGYWRGKQERCAIVVISADESVILATVADLNRTLSQECIGVTYADAMQFI